MPRQKYSTERRITSFLSTYEPGEATVSVIAKATKRSVGSVRMQLYRMEKLGKAVANKRLSYLDGGEPIRTFWSVELYSPTGKLEKEPVQDEKAASEPSSALRELAYIWLTRATEDQVLGFLQTALTGEFGANRERM